MEGLLIAEELDRLAAHIPAERMAFRFLDEDTIVLPLVGGPAIWMYARPPHPRLETRERAPSPTGPVTGFQELLVARASGNLERVEQPELDRIAIFRFAAAEGFVRSDACRLVFELTGRNCNLILTDPGGTILGAAREVPAAINRYRQVRPGLTYQPPPPYEKLDPRTAPPEAVAAALAGKKLKNLHKALDGIGPELTRTVSVLARVPEDDVLEDDALDRVLAAIRDLAAAPAATMRGALNLPDASTLRRRERRQELLDRARAELERRRDLAEKRIRDGHRTLQAAEEAAAMRERADLLMAFQHRVPDHVASVRLEDFGGAEVTIELDPKLDAVGNAESLYTQARKRERRGRRARQRIRELEEEKARLDARLAGLQELPTPELEALDEILAPTDDAVERKVPGIRFQGPHGFEVVVGRSAKENDVVTFQIARSRDVWLHVQGYHGSHVIVRAQNREVPFDTILFAAQLAAGHSQAAASENVPVDYTLKKNVWKSKGMPPGAVRFTQQKTVYVTPRRHVPRNGEREV